MATLYNFADYAEAVGYPIAVPAPRSRDHLPPIAAYTDVWRANGDYIGSGIVIAHATDPECVIVSVNGIRHVVRYTGCGWSRIGGAAFRPD